MLGLADGCQLHGVRVLSSKLPHKNGRTLGTGKTACRSGVVCSPLVSPDTRKSPPQTTLAEILRYSQRAALPIELGAGGPLVHAVSGTPIRCLRAPLGAGRNSKQEAIQLQVCFDPSRREHTTRCGAGSFIPASCSPSEQAMKEFASALIICCGIFYATVLLIGPPAGGW